MRILVYDVLEHEVNLLKKISLEVNDEIELTTSSLSLDTVDLAKGYDGVSIVSYSVIDKPVIDKLVANGVKHLSTRTIGFEHIDIKYAQSSGMHIYNAFYQPYNVADFTVMQMLNILRKAKISICRALVNDFSLDGMQGREMRSMTVGIIGTGKVGKAVIDNLSGFGCKLLAYDLYENPDLKNKVQYVDLETLYSQCDIISLHCPATKENYHMIDETAINKMKDGVILINTARGSLIDTPALIKALEKEKVGGAALDSVEGEEGIMHVHVGTKILDNQKRDLLYLKQFPNVIYTQHYGFYTKEASESMVRSGIGGLIEGFNNHKPVNEITKY